MTDRDSVPHPVARGRPRRTRTPQPTPPPQEELDALPADRRLELMDLTHQRRHRRFNTWILAAGVLATVGTLLVTALTLRSGQEQLNLAREGQVTDRYSKAVEQLAADKREVRAAAVYALERIAKDSPRDRQTIRDVLAAFIREHDPDPTAQAKDLPDEPDIDVAAALTVLVRRSTDPEGTPPLDLHNTRLSGANLSDANLKGVNLTGADLSNAKLTGTKLRDANLDGAKLTGADLSDADLTGVDLARANLTRANLTGADLSDADLTGADLARANLTRANLSDADLTDGHLSDAYLHSTQLSRAFLTDADLTGAYMAFVRLIGAVWSEGTIWPSELDTRWLRQSSERVGTKHWRVVD
ncbi:pentapeptide repeat-containing protein [Actinomadura miaoliensis]|uniref:Pentapeptide repeat-containing protein n=1 Tax=Actinomadura miaoliensis TaxID=430685 RepID=A0ABP7X5V8_9ACTN